jgi:hypothetical protein
VRLDRGGEVLDVKEQPEGRVPGVRFGDADAPLAEVLLRAAGLVRGEAGVGQVGAPGGEDAPVQDLEVARVRGVGADDRLGGHAHTHDLVDAREVLQRVDTGFIVRATGGASTDSSAMRADHER